ncbi:hypothetical protein ACFQL1_15055 [Halomicroarcula sp. GCM10025709]|uniref:hypothetical protein n=1 Tax=Haloarcula TaxID=2237 RepID=UPI0024C30D95|nr:hypothetical protein [Halomicroarcula sp. YJ-61-S]
MEPETAIRRVQGRHHHDTARFSITSSDGDFSIEYAADLDCWNVAADPPRSPPLAQHRIHDAGRNYVMVRATVSEPEAVVVELDDLMEGFGGEHAHVTGITTFERYKGAPTLSDLVETAKSAIGRVV